MINNCTVLDYNPRHIKTVKRDKYVEKPVFKTWIPDNADIVTQMLTRDRNQWGLREICSSDKEYRQLESIIVHHHSLLTDTYRLLQTKSKNYPWLNLQTMKKDFFNPVVVE